MPRRAATARRPASRRGRRRCRAAGPPGRAASRRGRDDPLDERRRRRRRTDDAARRDERERRAAPSRRSTRAYVRSRSTTRDGPVAREAEAEQRGEVGVALRLARRAEHRGGDADAVGRGRSRPATSPRAPCGPSCRRRSPGIVPSEVVGGHDDPAVGERRAAPADVPPDDGTRSAARSSFAAVRAPSRRGPARRGRAGCGSACRAGRAAAPCGSSPRRSAGACRPPRSRASSRRRSRSGRACRSGGRAP